MMIKRHSAPLKSNSCKYEQGKPGKRHDDAQKLFDKLATQILKDREEFACAMKEGESYEGPSKKRKGIEIEARVNNLHVYIKCDASCQNQGMWSKCLVEPFMLLPAELAHAPKKRAKKNGKKM